MRKSGSYYDVAVIGGGLAGLALSIQSARAGYNTILFEKEQYPFHRVCGEYISLESWNFLEDLGLPLSDMNLPIIKRVQVSAPNGNTIEHQLPLGGFGISRYTIDQLMAEIAKRAGVHVIEGVKITEARFNGSAFELHPDRARKATQDTVHAYMVAGSYGKRSNLDVKWERDFVQHKPNKLNNYIGVKYHIRTEHPPDLIALHNFSNGYCGISQIEDNKYCLCYLTTAENLKQCGNSIREMEKTVLAKNPFLEKIFHNADFVLEEPVTISQISFEKKSLVQDHVLMVGDAAGMITPLCGNGMSMALHAGKLAFREMDAFLQNDASRQEMETRYAKAWKKHFAGRMRIGRFIQRFFGHAVLSNVLISSIKPFPRVAGWLIRQTHGEPF
ncbi:MAG TPA: NAD(P)/FAD-dependent oxidoreductase [Chitinophagaceae bacterium]|nr:NAD(P)/FAD-dependent oxidoreductase [Chitinophagaceae bacterium]